MYHGNGIGYFIFPNVEHISPIWSFMNIHYFLSTTTSSVWCRTDICINDTGNLPRTEKI